MAGQFPVPAPTDRNSAILANTVAGCINSTTSITLTANAASTTLTDPNLTPEKFVNWDPLTANAAAELAAGTMYVLTANRGAGSWTVTHANNAQVDRTFKVLIIGG
jgi:hypothetical protein